MGLARQHPFASPLGCGTALLVIIGVAVVVWLSGGEQFSPGDLSAQALLPADASTAGGFASHAEFEKDCGACHVPFQGISAGRCELCHTRVAAERAGGTGLHGSSKATDMARCQTCHGEHQGRAANLSLAAQQKFSHQNLNFSLARHQRDYSQHSLATACAACHTGNTYAVGAEPCLECHGAHDAAFMQDHAAAFGDACLACHDGVDKMKGFDHSQTQFPLTAKHAAAACIACHQAGLAAKETPTTCSACHAEPAAHAGMFGLNCGACHTADGWSPATLNKAPFSHAGTGFALTSHTKDYTGSRFTCSQCHAGAIDGSTAGAFTFDQRVCVTCHTTADAPFMADHSQKFGTNCLSCHDGSGNLLNFDHQTIFPLDGKHAPLACEKCHVNKTFKGTPRVCAGCHAEPKVHAGVFGTDCAPCHTTTAWKPARLTQHTFPLNHGNRGDVTCVTCHPDKYTAYTCYGCHDHNQAEITRKHAEENISGTKLNGCVACHATGKKEDN